MWLGPLLFGGLLLAAASLIPRSYTAMLSVAMQQPSRQRLGAGRADRRRRRGRREQALYRPFEEPRPRTVGGAPRPAIPAVRGARREIPHRRRHGGTPDEKCQAGRQRRRRPALCQRDFARQPQTRPEPHSERTSDQRRGGGDGQCLCAGPQRVLCHQRYRPGRGSAARRRHPGAPGACRLQPGAERRAELQPRSQPGRSALGPVLPVGQRQQQPCLGRSRGAVHGISAGAGRSARRSGVPTDARYADRTAAPRPRQYPDR